MWCSLMGHLLAPKPKNLSILLNIRPSDMHLMDFYNNIMLLMNNYHLRGTQFIPGVSTTVFRVLKLLMFTEIQLY